MIYKKIFNLVLLLLIGSKLYANVWNSPYIVDDTKIKTLYSAFSTPPKHLDPVVSYSSNEWAFIGQIYEPPLQYNYTKRPYELEPLTLKEMPRVDYLDENKTIIDENSPKVMYTKYTLNLKKNIKYYNHPAFVKTDGGELKYANLTKEQLKSINDINDFKETSTRTLLASDYEYAIKRMGVRQNHSPILDNMAEYIVGLKEYSKQITQIAKQKKAKQEPLDLRSYSIEGVKVESDYRLSITIKGKYPQFSYWLSMYFFAPIAWEADLFYQQEGLKAKNLTLNWQPVGTGAYYLAKNNPSAKMVLQKNPNFHRDGLPHIDRVVYTLEKESIPLWNKFLQGYYDASSISSEAFSQTINISSSGNMGLSKSMKDKGIVLKESIEPSIFYMAFNMEDPVVGGYSLEAKKLRQAISIAQNQEEYISIFMNERGIPAQGPIPFGIFGYYDGDKGCNSVVYECKDNKRVRKSLKVAKRLLAEAGYPNGISKKSGKQLKLHYDATATGPDDRSLIDWRRKQFAKLGIELVIRSTDYNRFQDKVRKAKVQIFSWGWNADYPDPENFLFLLYGANAIVNTDGAGINSSNYQNPKFDALFNQIKTMKNSPQRAKLIQEMLTIVREDAPWVWGFHPKSMTLLHSWFKNVIPNAMANNTLKYKRIDAKLRAKKQKEWNQPHLMPLVLFVLFSILSSYLLYRVYVNRQKAVIEGES